MPETKRRWTIAPKDPEAAEAIRQALACPAPIAELLVARNICTPEQTRVFFEPVLDDLHDPGLLLGMSEAVERIRQALANAEPILIYGDYDVDGTVATVLLKTALERLAPPDRPAQVSYHVPHRLREGYGMQTTRLAQAKAEGVQLVISVDTGIRAFAAADEARSLGLDLIVTDHHLPDGVTGLPDALAVINPAQPGCPYPNKHLCGAGVAFKLAHALLASEQRTNVQVRRLLPSFMKLVALATIADSVALTGENRTIAMLGLRELANPVQPGLRALMQVAKLPLDTSPTATEVGFRLAPRINAAGRMDIASDVVEMFLTRDVALADTLAHKLDNLNTDRRATEAAALEAIDIQLLSLRAEGEFAPECIVLSHPGWHRGVLGILASRVVERTGRPALVLQEEEDQAHGSGRSVEGFHLLDALTAAHAVDDNLFTRFGGHAHAVGFSLPKANLPFLRERLRAHAATHLTSDLLTPVLQADLELEHQDLTLELHSWLSRCAPFGQENPEPCLYTSGLTLAAAPRVIKERHVCLQLQTNDGRTLNAMGWSRTGTTPWPERIASLQPGDCLDVLFRMRQNKHPQYGGLELGLIDLRPQSNMQINALP